MSIADNINQLIKEIPPEVKIIAISKTHSPEIILEAYHAGLRLFGENRVQELTAKVDLLPGDIQWHMVGHLQTNKVKFIAPFVSLIHSIDSLKLLVQVDHEALKNNRIQNCLLQIHIAREEMKFGLSVEELKQLLHSKMFRDLHNIRINGLMGIATFTDQKELIRSEFRYLSELFKEIKSDFFAECDYFCELSMGMSGDYKIAIEEGATMIRIGTMIFGERSVKRET
jgi:hypothetical protein